MRDVVWTATVDDNTWRIDVVRTDDYRANLEIYRVDGDELVHTEQVGLTYQAMFGPDVDDVAQWQHRSLEVIDSQ